MANHNDLISIIVPVYNVEKYIEKCLASLIGQTYRNIEIVLVDDGATDSSGCICDTFAMQDDRIKVIHKKNGGLSDARNVGITKATGKYLVFVDSDDDVKLDMVQYLYELIIKSDCKMALCTHTVVLPNGKELSYGNCGYEVLSAKECIRRLCYHDVIDTSAWAKIYDADIFKQVNFPKGKLFEDIGTTYKTFILSGKIACGYESKYNYYVRNNSIVTGSFKPAKLDLLEMTDKMGEEVLQFYPDLTKAVLRRRVYARFSTLNQMLDVVGYEKERASIINFINEHRAEVMADNFTPLRDRLAILLLGISYKLYSMVWKLHFKFT